MAESFDMGAVQLVVCSQTSFDMLRMKSAEYRRLAELSRIGSDEERLYLATARGLDQLAQTEPNVGMSHATLQVYIRTANGRKKPLSRADQKEVMEKIVEFVQPIMEMDKTSPIRSKRYTRKKPADETPA